MLQKNLPQPNNTCCICGRDYYVCKPCIENRDKGIFGFKLICCSPDCYEVYLKKVEEDEKTAEIAKNAMLKKDIKAE